MTSNRYAGIILSLLAAMGMTACGSDSSQSPAPPAPEPAPAVSSVPEPEPEATPEPAPAPEPEAEPTVVAASAPTGGASLSAGDDCSMTMEVGDAIVFSANEMTVSSGCSEVTVTLTHTGQLPAIAMGHNWVLVPEAVAQEIAMAGIASGPDGNYLPAGEDRIVAATRLIGGGESDSVTFSLGDLQAGTDYVYVCTFPGHSTIMIGKFNVTG